MYTEKKAAELKVIFVNEYLHYKTHRCVTFLHVCVFFAVQSAHEQRRTCTQMHKAYQTFNKCQF
jgi:hypothetical protein